MTISLLAIRYDYSKTCYFRFNFIRQILINYICYLKIIRNGKHFYHV